MQNKQTLKESLIELFNGRSSKSYAKLVSSRSELYKQVYEYQLQTNSKSLAEALWCIINETTPLNCPCGGIRQFNTFNLGYRDYCGIKCVAKNQEHGKKISSLWKNNPEKLQTMISNRSKTNLEKYGFTNAALAPEVKHRTKLYLVDCRTSRID